MAVLVTLEIIQLRGFIFSTHPLKPDFSRLNPAKGLKRLFSLRLLKETLKNIVKFAIYGFAAWWIISGAISTWGIRLVDARSLTNAIEASGAQLLFVFIAIAAFFMVIDQIIVRGEFRKQMCMGRSELTREVKEREGDPRQKQKRKDLHKQMRDQSESLGQIAGSDVLIVNPEHFAVALRYDPKAMDAPVVAAKGRDHFAQLMKRKARLHNIPIIEDVNLARNLHADCARNSEIGAQHYHAVARIYRKLKKTDELSENGELQPQTDPVT
jgi:flagellar biosynthetic protein FlhB